jgi:hypothetical protein
MERWAKENPSEYYRLFARLIPQATEVSGPEGGPVQHELGYVALPPVAASLAEWRANVAEVFGEYGAAAPAGADERPE